MTTIKNLKKRLPSNMNIIYLRSESASNTWMGNPYGQGEYILVSNGKAVAMGKENIDSYLTRNNL